MDRIPGFAPGIVTTNEDPEGTGRIKVMIPGLIEPETPYWVMPGNWPGGGRGDRHGSQYPPPAQGSQVAVIFEYGIYADPDAHAFYFGGYYGLSPAGTQAGPEILDTAASAGDAQKHVVLWEGASLLAYVVESDTEERLVLCAKRTMSKIEIDAKAGADGNSEAIYIEARTLLSLYSKGVLDIRADGGVQIQGRVVDDITTAGI